jgi:alpha-N-acetylglucosaminidase
MSRSGINMMLALTGQEELQYKVFSKLGLSDKDIRSWFNGPAFLTWSRGQNEYGNNICGPLPRSWMQDQWAMQREHILPRLRSLGITGQLPGFQGNVPIQLKEVYNDTNITQQRDTGWMDSLDPLLE